MKSAKLEPEYRRVGAGGIDSPQASPEGSVAGEHPYQIITRNREPVSVILPIKATKTAGTSRGRRRCRMATKKSLHYRPLSEYRADKKAPPADPLRSKMSNV